MQLILVFKELDCIYVILSYIDTVSVLCNMYFSVVATKNGDKIENNKEEKK